jgi:hypothetical protein
MYCIQKSQETVVLVAVGFTEIEALRIPPAKAGFSRQPVRTVVEWVQTTHGGSFSILDFLDSQIVTGTIGVIY